MERRRSRKRIGEGVVVVVMVVVVKEEEESLVE